MDEYLNVVTRRLTEEQRTLADDNRGLAGSAAKRVWIKDHRRSDIEDLKQAAMVGLCEAAISFNCDVGVSFATYATRACYNAALHEVVTQGVICRPHWHAKKILIHHPVERMLGIKARRTQEFLINRNDVPAGDRGYLGDHIDVDVILATLGKDDREILESWASGETQMAIGLRIGVVTRTINKRIRQIRERLARRFG